MTPQEAIAQTLRDEISLPWGAQTIADAIVERLRDEGYAIVPREPTNEMAEVGTEARWKSAVRSPDNVREIWRAMVNAVLAK